MRLSALKDDPGFRHDYWRFDVVVDGVSVAGADPKPMIVIADEEAGVVVEYRRGEDGRVIRDDTGERCRLFVRKADVKIKPLERVECDRP